MYCTYVERSIFCCEKMLVTVTCLFFGLSVSKYLVVDYVVSGEDTGVVLIETERNVCWANWWSSGHRDFSFKHGSFRSQLHPSIRPEPARLASSCDVSIIFNDVPDTVYHGFAPHLSRDCQKIDRCRGSVSTSRAQIEADNEVGIRGLKRRWP